MKIEEKTIKETLQKGERVTQEYNLYQFLPQRENNIRKPCGELPNSKNFPIFAGKNKYP